MGKRVLQVSFGFFIFYILFYNVYLLLTHEFNVLDYDFFFPQIYDTSYNAIVLIAVVGFVLAFIENRNICTLLPMCFYTLQFIYNRILYPYVFSNFMAVNTKTLINFCISLAFIISLMARHIKRREFLMIAAYVVVEALILLSGKFYPSSENEIVLILYFCVTLILDIALYVLKFTSVSTDTE